jgi:hypothetical protein
MIYAHPQWHQSAPGIGIIVKMGLQLFVVR